MAARNSVASPKPDRAVKSRAVKRVTKSPAPEVLGGRSAQGANSTASAATSGRSATERKRGPKAQTDKKKAAGTGPAARKAAKKTAKAQAAKKPAPIAQLQPAKSGGIPATPVERSAIQHPISIPEAWPFPMGNRS